MVEASGGARALEEGPAGPVLERSGRGPASGVAWRRVQLTGWGRTARVETLACCPDDAGGVIAALAGCQEPILAYGAGRSYGDAALNGRGRTILTRGLDRVRAFAPQVGEIVCEAGVRLCDLLDAFLPRGWLPPVSPGTAYTTVGGAVANDVHGKNHEHAGSFARHVAWLDLALPGGDVRRIAPASEPALFAATVGGIGLTGVILQVCFRLQRAPGTQVELTERRVLDLDAFMAAFEACRARATFSVGWIDALARGRHFGRGILETAEFAPQAPAGTRRRRRHEVPFDLPSTTLNPLTVRLFNAFYFRRIPRQGRTRIVPLPRFLYPLDAILNWNRIYGRRGFYQFQCVIPDREAGTGITRLLEAISRARRGSFLAVLKTLGPGSGGHLSFPLQGYTLALDFPCSASVPALARRLEEITLEHGGRVYLAKDALLSPAGFRAMYPGLQRFREVLAEVDPAGRISSDMARRLRIRDG